MRIVPVFGRPARLTSSYVGDGFAPMSEKTIEERIAALEKAVKEHHVEGKDVFHQFEIITATIRMNEDTGPSKHHEVKFSRPVKKAFPFMQGWNLTWGEHEGQPLWQAQVFCNEAHPKSDDPHTVAFTVNLWMVEDDHHKKLAHGGWHGVVFMGIIGIIE